MIEIIDDNGTPLKIQTAYFSLSKERTKRPNSKGIFALLNEDQKKELISARIDYWRKQSKNETTS